MGVFYVLVGQDIAEIKIYKVSTECGIQRKDGICKLVF